MRTLLQTNIHPGYKPAIPNELPKAHFSQMWIHSISLDFCIEM